MISSMTGFGGASTEDGGRHLSVEVRSLNSRYYKGQVRTPEGLQSLEAEIESRLAKRLTRGSVTVTVRCVDHSAAAAASLNPAAIQRYIEQFRALPAFAEAHTGIDIGSMLSLPGVIIDDTAEMLTDAVRPAVMRLLDEAIGRLVAMRRREGEMLRHDLHSHCSRIAEHLAVVTEHVPQMIAQYQAKLRLRVEALLDGSSASLRDEDLLREVALFADRSDVAEEVARLQGHLAQFRERIDGADEEPVGRTLDFIAQEMLREANTIGSKCLDVEVSRRIVEIKSAIDRIKEQVQNVE